MSKTPVGIYKQSHKVMEPTRSEVTKPTITILKPAKDKGYRYCRDHLPRWRIQDLYWQLEGEEVGG